MDELENQGDGLSFHTPLVTVATRHVVDTLHPDELLLAFVELKEAMKVPDPMNPDLWSVVVGNHKLWGILDHGAGPKGEDVLTILFPSDY